MSNFGAQTDYFDEITDGLTLQDSSGPVTPKTRKDALDENGDICASTFVGATDIFDVSCDYELQSGDFNLNTLKLGEIDAVDGVIVDNITIATSNSGLPTIKISGRKGCTAVTAPSGKLNTFTLPSVTISALKAAQVMGFTVTGGSLTDSSFAFTATAYESTDGVGAPTAHGVSGAIGVLTANFVRCPDEDPAWTLSLADLTSVAEPGGPNEPNADYWNATGIAHVIVERDDDPA